MISTTQCIIIGVILLAIGYIIYNKSLGLKEGYTAPSSQAIASLHMENCSNLRYSSGGASYTPIPEVERFPTNITSIRSTMGALGILPRNMLGTAPNWDNKLGKNLASYNSDYGLSWVSPDTATQMANKSGYGRDAHGIGVQQQCKGYSDVNLDSGGVKKVPWSEAQSMCVYTGLSTTGNFPQGVVCSSKIPLGGDGYTLIGRGYCGGTNSSATNFQDCKAQAQAANAPGFSYRIVCDSSPNCKIWDQYCTSASELTKDTVYGDGGEYKSGGGCNRISEHPYTAWAGYSMKTAPPPPPTCSSRFQVGPSPPSCQYGEVKDIVGRLDDGTPCGGSCPGKPPVPGCTDPNALNYNSNATQNDSSCILPILGCRDSGATNYNNNANQDCNGCCTYDWNTTTFTCADALPQCGSGATAISSSKSCGTDCIGSSCGCICPAYKAGKKACFPTKSNTGFGRVPNSSGSDYNSNMECNTCTGKSLDACSQDSNCQWALPSERPSNDSCPYTTGGKGLFACGTKCCADNESCNTADITCGSDEYKTDSAIPCNTPNCTGECCNQNVLCSSYSGCSKDTEILKGSAICPAGACGPSCCEPRGKCSDLNSETACQPGVTYLPKNSTDTCDTNPCTSGACCKPNSHCFSGDGPHFSCPSGFTALEGDPTCKNPPCTQDDCCKVNETCQTFYTENSATGGCPSGLSKLSNPPVGPCKGATCKPHECCKDNPTCKVAGYDCQSTYFTNKTKSPDFDTYPCSSNVCTDADCCLISPTGKLPKVQTWPLPRNYDGDYS